MRVEAVEKIAKRAGGMAEAALDPSASLAIKNFLMVMESDDSLFRATQPLRGRTEDKPEGRCACVGEIGLQFRAPELAHGRKFYYLLSEKLMELLRNAGSRETLEAKVCLTSTKQEKTSREEPELLLQLTAIGDSPEQAVLRWGLGLAHIQQALLFTSRYLRQYVAQTGM